MPRIQDKPPSCSAKDMAVKVAAYEFHPMRGHVTDGVEIMFHGENSLFLKSDMRGWSLFDSAGNRVAGPNLFAYEVTDVIIKRLPA